NEFWGCCPFHNERTPSFKVDTGSQFYHCFGCGEHGDAFTFTMRTENVEFPEAVRMLAERAGIELADDREPGQRSQKARLLGACKAASDFYQRQLLRVKSDETDAARSYLAARGLGGQVARDWQLGYAPGRAMLVHELRQAGYTDDEMSKADLARRGAGGLSDRFFQRIVFPIQDLQGRPIAFGGRIFLPHDQSAAKYLNSSETPLFKKRDGLYAIHRARAPIVNSNEAIVVEGYTDTIALHLAGLTNTVATLGTALTLQHLRLLGRFCSRVVLLFDGDQAGQMAAERALDLLAQESQDTDERRRADVFVALLPGGLDPAEYMQANGGEALREVVAQAASLLHYGVERALAAFELARPEQRTRALDAAVRLLAGLRETFAVQEEENFISSVLLRYDQNLTSETVHEAVQAARQKAEKNVVKPAAQNLAAQDAGRPPSGPGSPGSARPTVFVSANQRRLEALERELLMLYCESPETRALLKPQFQKIRWANLAHAQIAGILVGLTANGPLLSELTARYPEAGSLLSLQRLVEASSLEPSKLALYLLFNLRDLQLKITIDGLNTQLRRVSADEAEKRAGLYNEINQLIQERSRLAKSYRRPDSKKTEG
ncbi:MAG: DNA primase, partial [Coriobacteriia bacterium]|nr:DNA primase [Coriobacteriia bacterium]